MQSYVTEPRAVATGPGYAVVPTAGACAVLRVSSRDDGVPRVGRYRSRYCNYACHKRVDVTAGRATVDNRTDAYSRNQTLLRCSSSATDAGSAFNCAPWLRR